MYDQIRYSLEDRTENRTNGIVAVYTPEAAPFLVKQCENGSISVSNVDNLFRLNMMNVKPSYKKESAVNLYDRDYDSYCSLVSLASFTEDIGRYIDLAIEKRDHRERYYIITRLQ